MNKGVHLLYTCMSNKEHKDTKALIEHSIKKDYIMLGCTHALKREYIANVHQLIKPVAR